MPDFSEDFTPRDLIADVSRRLAARTDDQNAQGWAADLNQALESLAPVPLSVGTVREWAERQKFEAGDEGSNDGEHDLLYEIVSDLERLTTVETSDLRPDALLPSDRERFDTLMEATANDDVLLLHARHASTGRHDALVCIKSAIKGSDDTAVIPVARMLEITDTYWLDSFEATDTED